MKIVKSYQVTGLDYDADRWELYQMGGAAEAAAALNNSFMTAVNAGKDRDGVEAAVWQTMDKYSKFGAWDTEPRGVLGDLIDAVFGEVER